MGTTRESVIVDMSAVEGVRRALDLQVDGHVHTGFAAGRDSIGAIVVAADRAGLSGVTFADQVGPDTAWLPAYADAVRRAQSRTELHLRVSAEVEVVQHDGWLAWPVDLGDLEGVSVAVSRLPMIDGPVGPQEVRRMLIGGQLERDRVIDMVMRASIQGIERASRYAPAQLARPLSLLTQVGIAVEELAPERFTDLVNACRVTNTVVEISEAWRSPSARLVGMFRAAGVAMVAASDARYADEVGRWHYLPGLLAG